MLDKKMVEKAEKVLDKIPSLEKKGSYYEFKTYADYMDEIYLQEYLDIEFKNKNIMDNYVIEELENDLLDTLITNDCSYNFIMEEIEGVCSDFELLEFINDNYYEFINIYYSELDLLYDLNVDVNIVLSTKNERNTDNTKIITDYVKNNNSLDNVEDSGIRLLLNYVNNTDNNSELVQSIIEEIENAPYKMNEITMLAKISVSDLIKIQNKQYNYIEIDKDTLVGLYNRWNGSGSLFDITLPNNLIIPKGEIENKNVGIRGVKYCGYSVEEVYGFGSGDRIKISVK